MFSRPGGELKKENNFDVNLIFKEGLHEKTKKVLRLHKCADNAERLRLKLSVNQV